MQKTKVLFKTKPHLSEAKNNCLIKELLIKQKVAYGVARL